jgi:hypothetical protein
MEDPLRLLPFSGYSWCWRARSSHIDVGMLAGMGKPGLLCAVERPSPFAHLLASYFTVVVAPQSSGDLLLSLPVLNKYLHDLRLCLVELLVRGKSWPMITNKVSILIKGCPNASKPDRVL